MPTREELHNRIAHDGIRFLLAQFVVISGSPKVNMVPANCLDDVADTGAGFAGAALWGMGQGPHSHDMMGRIIEASAMARIPLAGTDKVFGW